MMYLPFKQTLRSLQFKVQVVPRAQHDQIVGLTDDKIEVTLKSAVNRNTNRALIAILARQFGLSSQQLTLIQGYSSLEKTVAVVGVSAQEFNSRLQLAV